MTATCGRCAFPDDAVVTSTVIERWTASGVEYRRYDACAGHAAAAAPTWADATTIEIVPCPLPEEP